MGTQLAQARQQEDEHDRVLMKKVVRGDKRAAEGLYRQYCDRVYQSCLRITCEPEDAIDAMQETFLNVFRRMKALDPDTTSFRDYLFASARNTCLKQLEKRKHTDPTEDVPEPKVKIADDAHMDPERSLLIGDQRKIIRNASTELSDRHYRALVMYELDGLGYAEIGRQFDLDANAVAQLIMRARQRLRWEVRRHVALNPAGDHKQCAQALALLPKRADGRLGERESAWLDPHLENCEICATNLALMEEVGARYRSVLPPALIALLWQRTGDAWAATSHPNSSGTTGTESTSRVADVTGRHGVSSSGWSVGGMRSRLDRTKRKVAALAPLLFVLLVAVCSSSIYMIQETPGIGARSLPQTPGSQYELITAADFNVLDAVDLQNNLTGAGRERKSVSTKMSAAASGQSGSNSEKQVSVRQNSSTGNSIRSRRQRERKNTRNQQAGVRTGDTRKAAGSLVPGKKSAKGESNSVKPMAEAEEGRVPLEPSGTTGGGVTPMASHATGSNPKNLKLSPPIIPNFGSGEASAPEKPSGKSSVKPKKVRAQKPPCALNPTKCK